ncbi:MAG TPA: chemotaxis protein CheB, partial [Gammaproteobacteria bacterium]|nr:chemotaxis protein CheB [Gammaproteobacteria bacterium]
TRYWTSLRDIAEENGMSRLYGGVHWEIDHTEAMTAGRNIARQAHLNLFRARV